MKSKLAIPAVVAMLVFGYWAATPYITTHNIKQAVEQKDAVALAEYVDFPAVRQSLKEQLKAAALKEFAADAGIAEDPFAVLGVALAGVVVDNVIDTFVTPAGVSQLAATGLPKFDPETGELAAAAPVTGPVVQDSSMSYDSLSMFSIRIKDRDGVEGRLVLRREGLFSWRLSDVQIQRDGQSSLFANGQTAHEATNAVGDTGGAVEDADKMAPIVEEAREEVVPRPTAEVPYSECMEQADGVTHSMHECLTLELERQDARLNSAYGAAMAAAGQREALRDAQRQWIVDRDRECEAEAGEWEGGSMYGVIYTDCMVQLTSTRADELQAMLTAGRSIDEQSRIGGAYSATEGHGYMTVTPTNEADRYSVDLSVGSGSCGGESLIDNSTSKLVNKELSFVRPEGAGACKTTVSFTLRGAVVSDTCISPEDEDESTCALMGSYKKG